MGLFAFGKTVDEAREVARLEREERERLTAQLEEQTGRLHLQSDRLGNAELRLAREQERIRELEGRVEVVTMTLEAVKRTEATRVRIATLRLDPRELTSRLRTVATNVKVEYEPATFRYVVYADEMPQEKGINAVRAVFQAALDIDRT